MSGSYVVRAQQPEWASPRLRGEKVWSSDWVYTGLSFYQALDKYAGLQNPPRLVERYAAGKTRFDLYEGGLIAQFWNGSEDDISKGPIIYRVKSGS